MLANLQYYPKILLLILKQKTALTTAG